MKTVTLGKTGIVVSQLGFGAMYIPRISPEESDTTILRALEKGVNYFDTSIFLPITTETPITRRILATLEPIAFPATISGSPCDIAANDEKSIKLK